MQSSNSHLANSSKITVEPCNFMYYLLITFNEMEHQHRKIFGSSVCVMQCTGVIRDGTLIEKNVWRFLSIVFDLERTNQLNLLPDKDLVYLCHPIEP